MINSRANTLEEVKAIPPSTAKQMLTQVNTTLGTDLMNGLLTARINGKAYAQAVDIDIDNEALLKAINIINGQAWELQDQEETTKGLLDTASNYRSGLLSEYFSGNMNALKEAEKAYLEHCSIDTQKGFWYGIRHISGYFFFCSNTEIKNINKAKGIKLQTNNIFA